MDSTVLLHWLASSSAQRQAGLTAVHIHHGLQTDADLWAQHCDDICKQFGVPYQCVRVEVTIAQAGGVEDAARRARQGAFKRLLQKAHRLALAHHQEDQAETWLLRALRASGVDGLSAMRQETGFGQGTLWRPFLDVSRAQLQTYAQEHKLHWIEDPSNADDHFHRNYLRQHIFPRLRARWPQVSRQFARAAKLSSDASDLLRAEDQILLQQLLNGQSFISIAAWLQFSPARRARLLRLWCIQNKTPPLPANGITAIEDFVVKSPSDRQASFCWGKVAIRRWRDALHIVVQTHRYPPGWNHSWNGLHALALPVGGCLILKGPVRHSFPCPISVRARQGGERFRLPGRTHSHALKHLLQEAGTPPWVRQQLPLLYHNDALWAVGDIWIATPCIDWLYATQQTLLWIRPEQVMQTD